MLKVALLVPESEGYLQFAERLIDLGVGAELFICAGSDDEDFLAATKALAAARGFDLVHNFLGVRELVLAHLIKEPIVTTINKAPDEATETFLQEISDSYYIATDERMMEDSSLEWLGVADALEADDYLPFYTAALDLCEHRRPWGHYDNLAEGADHKIKRIVVAPGKRLSLQKHQRRKEHWFVISGEAVVTLDGVDMILKPGEAVDIPKGATHRVRNDGASPLIFAEVQLGDYFGEDDIIRLEDDYGR